MANGSSPSPTPTPPASVRLLHMRVLLLFILPVLYVFVDYFSAVAGSQGLHHQFAEPATSQTKRQAVVPPYSSRPSTPNRLPRAPHDQQGSWLGNTWIPPTGWILYSAQDLLELYRNERLWFIGDSTSRRASLTLYALLNSTAHSYPSNTTRQNITHPTFEELDDKYELSVNKNNVSKKEFCGIAGLDGPMYAPKICRTMPGTNSTGLVMNSEGITCTNRAGWVAEHFESIFGSNKTDTFSKIRPDVTIFSLGVWEIKFPHVCRFHDENTPLDQRIVAAIDKIEAFQRATNQTVVWRTSNYMHVNADSAQADMVRRMNGQVMGRIAMHRANDTRPVGHPRLTALDWGGAMEPRALGALRIKGDMNAHMGLEPRLMLLQQLTNHLFDVGYFAMKQQEQASAEL